MPDIVLTAPELQLLKNLAWRRQAVASNFPPLVTLLRHGFAAREQGFAIRPTGNYLATKAGEQYLESLEDMED